MQNVTCVVAKNLLRIVPTPTWTWESKLPMENTLGLGQSNHISNVYRMSNECKVDTSSQPQVEVSNTGRHPPKSYPERSFLASNRPLGQIHSFQHSKGQDDHPDNPSEAKWSQEVLHESESARLQRYEDSRISRLEHLLIEQQQARIEKEAAKRRAAQESAAKEKEERRRGDVEKLQRLERLILAQKEEHSRKEVAAEATRQVDRAEAARNAREEAELKASKEAEETRLQYESSLRELEAAKKTAEEEAARYITSELKPIKLKDAAGRNYTLPWQLCKTWTGMEELLRQSLWSDANLGSSVLGGLYYISDEQGAIILPQVWDSVVQPGSELTIHLSKVPSTGKGLKLSRGLSRVFRVFPSQFGDKL